MVATALRPLCRRAQPVLEQQAVGQARQRIAGGASQRFVLLQPEHLVLVEQPPVLLLDARDHRFHRAPLPQQLQVYVDLVPQVGFVERLVAEIIDRTELVSEQQVLVFGH